MLSGILEMLRPEKAVTQPVSNRRHERRKSDKCVSLINGKMLPVVDWSFGGAQIACDERIYALGDTLDVALKFQLRDDIVDIQHKARIVRKNRSRIAVEFEPLTREIRERFQSVIDDYITREFADSQMA
ncbi:MAG: PilZ domain-containing protein [Alphaproteobacteria bacterium]